MRCQSPWDHAGELSHARFFDAPEFQKRCSTLWKAIAHRYIENPSVFAYDLLNEPFGARAMQNWTEAHDLIYDAIRSVDARTITVMEDGYKLEAPNYRKTGCFPDPKKLGWHYSPWTWKYVNDEGEGSIWGVYQYNLLWERTPNMYRDSKESLLDLISNLGTENCSLHGTCGKILREVLTQRARAAK